MKLIYKHKSTIYKIVLIVACMLSVIVYNSLMY